MSSARDYYGVPEATLLEWLRDAQNDKRLGKTRTSAGQGDLNQSSQVYATPEQRIREIQQALYQLNPDGYPQFATIGQNRSRPIFTFGATQI